MQTVIGVRFKKAGKIYYFGPGQIDIQKDDYVIVETARGVECGHVAIGPRDVEDSEITQPLKVIERKATPDDLERVEENKKREVEATRICEEKIAARALPMKLVGVEYTFDINKIVFYFTADGRVDFRELVKDLAAVFRTRIELRQIGVRDEAKMLGGIGCCGRPLCCATFLGEFVPVSIRMAKEQNLSLNPTKISGICGRLMCCLKYENDDYEGRCDGCSAAQQKKVLPPTQGGRVVTTEGEGKVISLNQQKRNATILLDDNKTLVASWEDVIEKEPEEEPDLANIAALAAIAAMEDPSLAGYSRSRHSKRKSNERARHGRDEKSHEGRPRDERPPHGAKAPAEHPRDKKRRDSKPKNRRDRRGEIENKNRRLSHRDIQMMMEEDE
ncbi:MAG: stage 0 sporulation protein [Schwartzia sp.]|nr:stage 0 sporulation protein [Schwartzia sp. (in: firmicutes)]